MYIQPKFEFIPSSPAKHEPIKGNFLVHVGLLYDRRIDWTYCSISGLKGLEITFRAHEKQLLQ